MVKHQLTAAVLVSFCAAGICQGQRIITTVAGSDITYPQSPFPANSATFGQLISVAVSPNGAVYFVSETRAMVLRLDPSTQTVSIVAGIGISGYSGDGGPATLAELNNPQAIAFDSAGNLYIADDGNAVIRKVGSQGTITTIANAPNVVGLTIASDGTLYYSTYFQVIHINANGTKTVIAGGQGPGYGGDGGPAIAALVSNASGLIFDHAGNLLVADSANNRIRRIDTNGVITTIAGSGLTGTSTTGPAIFTPVEYPIGLALDAAGNLYASSYVNGQLLKIDAQGQLTILNSSPSSFFFATPGPVTQAELIPAWPAFDRAGDLYVTDFSGCLWEINPAGSIQVVAAFAPNFELGDNGPAPVAHLNAPGALAVAPDGSVLVTEQFNSRIRRISPTGTISSIAGNGIIGFTSPGPALSTSLYRPNSVASDPSGNIFTESGGNVYKMNSAGILSLFYAGASSVTGVATDAQGNVFVTTNGNQVFKLTPNGVPTLIAGTGALNFGGDGGPAVSATLNNPMGIAVDFRGNVFIADAGNARIRVISPSGIISTFAGGGSTEVDGVQATQSAAGPQAVAVDSSGNVYFVELFNARVREVSTNGIVSTIAGTGVAGFSGDGGLATSAMLNEPAGIGVDGAGNIYIADRVNNRIRQILLAPPSMSISSNQVTVSAPSTGAPVQFSVGVSTSTPGLAYSLSFSTQTGGNWLSSTITQGQAPGVFSIIADPTNLAPNQYQGTVIVTNPRAVPSSYSISVNFQVTDSVQPKLTAGDAPVNFSLNVGGASASSQLTVSNQGGGSLSFTASASTSTVAGWLQVSPMSGTATASAAAPLTVTVTPGSLAAGTYSGTITVRSTTAGQSVSVAVTLVINAANQKNIVLSQSGLTFTSVIDGGAPLAQSVGILNTGEGSMTWSASANTLAGGPWLSIDQMKGTVATPNTDVSLVHVSVNPSGLAPGTYYGQIQVTAPGAPNSPQSVSVSLNVLAAGSSPGAEVQPSGLIFIGQTGNSPGSQAVTISNLQAGSITFGGSFFTVPTGGDWVRFLPVNATVTPNAPLSMLVQPDYSNLAPGVYQGFVSLGFADGSPAQTINVLSVVAPSGATPNSTNSSTEKSEPKASGCGGLPLNVQFRSLQPNFTAVLGQATSVDVQVADACGNLVGPPSAVQGGSGSPALSYVTASLTNGDPQVVLTPLGNGIWQGTWKPVTGAGAVTLTVNAGGPNGTGQNKVTGTIIAPAPSAMTPTVTAQGVLHAASDQGGVPISPGELITIYGMNLADQMGQSSGLPLQTQLGGTQVLLGNQPLPILYSGAGQLNVQVPYAVPVNTQSQLTVQHGNSLSLPQSLVIAQAQPGIFTVNQQGTGQGSIFKSDGVTLAQSGTPAAIGETVVIYCAGLGAVTPAVKEGTAAPMTPPLAMTTLPVTVTIGGQPAQVTFSGLAPGFAGLYQVNAIVPSGITTGDTVPVMMTAAGQTSPPVTMAVQ